MSKIRKVIPGKTLPFTTVEDALAFGNRKVREAQMIRNEQIRIQENLLASMRQGRGTALEPFNFTTVLERMMGKNRENEPAGRLKDGAANNKGKKREEKQPAKEIEVKVDEHGAVLEEKDVSSKRPAKGASVQNATRNVKTVVTGPAASSLDMKKEMDDLKGRGRKVASNIVTAEGSTPSAMRLGKITGKTAQVQGRKSNEDIRGKVFYAENRQNVENKETPELRTEREPEQRDPQKVMLETAYKPVSQKIIDEQNRTPKEKYAEKKTETEISKGIARTAAVVMAAAQTSIVTDSEKTQTRQTGKEGIESRANIQEQKPQQVEVKTTERQENILSMANPEKVDMGAVLMRAATITHVTGRELQFDRGTETLQIKKEGIETFAYINGQKAGMETAKEYMKDLGKKLGPEKAQQLVTLVSQLVKVPDLTMEQAVNGIKNPAATINPKVKGMGDVALDR